MANLLGGTLGLMLQTARPNMPAYHFMLQVSKVKRFTHARESHK